MIHNFQEFSTALAQRDKQLAALVDSANANFEAFASEEASLREALRLFPGALDQTEQTLAQDERAGRRARPRARAAAPVRAQPRARRCARRSRSSTRPRRSSATRSGPSPATFSRRSATCAPPTNDLAVVTPRLARSFGVLNKLLQRARLRPAGRRGAVPVLEPPGARTPGATMFNLQDAHGPVRRGHRARVAAPATTSLEQVILGNPQLGLLTRLLNLPPEQEACPRTTHPTSSCRDQADPQLRSHLRDGGVRAVVLRHPGLPVAELRRLGAAAAGGLPGDGRLPGGHTARAGGGRAHLRRARGPRQEEGAATRRPGSPTPSSRSTRATRRSPRTRARSCARRRCSARPTLSCRRAPASAGSVDDGGKLLGRPGGRDGAARRDPARLRPRDARAVLHLVRPGGRGGARATRRT